MRVVLLQKIVLLLLQNQNIMKKRMATIFCFLFTLTIWGQNAAFSDIPALPEQISTEAFDAFSLQLNKAKTALKDKKAAMEKENNAVAQKIDPAKIAASYSSGVSVDDVMAMQQRQSELLEANQRLNDATTRFNEAKQKLDTELKADVEIMQKKHNDYMNQCVGEVGNPGKCDAMRSDYDAMAKEMMKKYYIGKEAKYVILINSWLSEMPALYRSTITTGLTISEFNMGFTFPHKEDLANVSAAYEYTLLLNEIFSIPSVFWPIKL